MKHLAVYTCLVLLIAPAQAQVHTPCGTVPTVEGRVIDRVYDPRLDNVVVRVFSAELCGTKGATFHAVIYPNSNAANCNPGNRLVMSFGHIVFEDRSEVGTGRSVVFMKTYPDAQWQCVAR